MPKLHLTTGDPQARVIDLSTITLPCVLGRDSELSQVVIVDGQASRAHCVINRDNGRFTIEDLGSRNGTYLNDERVGKSIMKDGDVLRIGSTRIDFEDAALRTDDPLVGKRLGGFDLTAVLGKGRYGTVYRANQVALGRPVAVKVLGEEYRNDPERVQAFLTEARRAGRLNHPNLVQVHDVTQVGENYLLIMELMKCSAAELLHARGPLQEAMVVRMLSDIGKALAYAESQRLVHRDVKPDNILVNDEGTYKLADLGIATAIAADGQARQERTFGSPHYVAPEQARGGSIDGRADLYALGASAWHLLVGEPIFRGTSRQIVACHINAELPDLETIAPHLGDGVVELIYDLLEKDPAARPANAALLVKRVDELARHIQDDSHQGRQAPRRHRMRRRRRR